MSFCWLGDPGKGYPRTPYPHGIVIVEMLYRKDEFWCLWRENKGRLLWGPILGVVRAFGVETAGACLNKRMTREVCIVKPWRVKRISVSVSVCLCIKMEKRDCREVKLNHFQRKERERECIRCIFWSILIWIRPNYNEFLSKRTRYLSNGVWLIWNSNLLNASFLFELTFNIKF